MNRWEELMADWDTDEYAAAEEQYWIDHGEEISQINSEYFTEAKGKPLDIFDLMFGDWM